MKNDSLLELFKTSLIELGLSDVDAGLGANLLFARYQWAFAGERVYIKKHPVDRNQILKEFNGKNHRQLANKYNTSVRSIYRITDKKFCQF